MENAKYPKNVRMRKKLEQKLGYLALLVSYNLNIFKFFFCYLGKKLADNS